MLPQGRCSTYNIPFLFHFTLLSSHSFVSLAARYFSSSTFCFILTLFSFFRLMLRRREDKRCATKECSLPPSFPFLFPGRFLHSLSIDRKSEAERRRAGTKRSVVEKDRKGEVYVGRRSEAPILLPFHGYFYFFLFFFTYFFLLSSFGALARAKDDEM